MQAEHFDSLRLQIGYIYGAHRDIDAGTPINAFTPRAIVGAHLPHAVQADGRSTLDLIDPNGFVILAGGPSAHWDTVLRAGNVPLRLLVEGRDFALAEGSWTESVKLDADGALLLRPDGHILHVAAGATADQADAMERTLRDYLKMPIAEQM